MKKIPDQQPNFTLRNQKKNKLNLAKGKKK
jgi:hypothetical protein